jgi:hypothetical protein
MLKRTSLAFFYRPKKDSRRLGFRYLAPYFRTRDVLAPAYTPVGGVPRAGMVD